MDNITYVHTMDSSTPHDRFELCRSVAEECIQEAELRTLLAEKTRPVAYDGFEPSGRMHIAQGIMKVIYVNRLVAAGCHFKFWIADWFAMLNNKLNRDASKIKQAGQRMIDIWKVMGMDMRHVEFIWASEEIQRRSHEYWPLVMDIAARNSLKRIIRCSQIMGRKESDDLAAAQILYPCMQAADIFFLEADICQLGMDQRKVNMLAREYSTSAGLAKPIILSHHMLPGLLKNQEKMSKSNPNSAIFMDDTEEEVNLKIKQAYCPPPPTEDYSQGSSTTWCPTSGAQQGHSEYEVNPCLEYVRYIVLPWFGHFQTESRLYRAFEDVEADYYNNRSLHPSDVKRSLAAAINTILAPVRQVQVRDDGRGSNAD